MKKQPTEAQKEKAEERRQILRELWKKVAEMSEEQKQEFVNKTGNIVTCDGHPLSKGNTILLAYQAEAITVVGGFQQWKKHNRQVSKGQRALGIWIPKLSKDDENKDPSYFIFGSVFDISQTEEITK